MNVDRLYHPVTTLGPGERIALWTRGCTKRCPGCANPELWEPAPRAALAPDRLAALLRATAQRTGCHRLTVTGGDPLEQPCDLIALLTAVRDAFDDILVYTGYEFDELPDMLEEDQFRALFGDAPVGQGLCPCRSTRNSTSADGKGRALALQDETRTATTPGSTFPTAALVDVLIDGPYVEALNDGVCGLRGSTNQRLIVLNPALEKLYHEEERKPRSVQNAVFDGRALSIGIHGRPQDEETP